MAVANISAITRTEDGTYTWTVTDTYRGTMECRTNTHGEGVWVNGKQVTGTIQLSVRDVSATTRRRRVTQWAEARFGREGE